MRDMKKTINDYSWYKNCDACISSKNTLDYKMSNVSIFSLLTLTRSTNNVLDLVNYMTKLYFYNLVRLPSQKLDYKQLLAKKCSKLNGFSFPSLFPLPQPTTKFLIPRTYPI